MQKHVNIVDLAKSFRRSPCLQKSASIQPERASQNSRRYVNEFTRMACKTNEFNRIHMLPASEGDHRSPEDGADRQVQELVRQHEDRVAPVVRRRVREGAREPEVPS